MRKKSCKFIVIIAISPCLAYNTGQKHNVTGIGIKIAVNIHKTDRTVIWVKRDMYFSSGLTHHYYYIKKKGK